MDGGYGSFVCVTYIKNCCARCGASRYVGVQIHTHTNEEIHMIPYIEDMARSGGLGSTPKKMYRERLGDGVEYHSMSPTPRR